MECLLLLRALRACRLVNSLPLPLGNVGRAEDLFSGFILLSVSVIQVTGCMVGRSRL
jgi:hypothetical protein